MEAGSTAVGAAELLAADDTMREAPAGPPARWEMDRDRARLERR